MAIAPIVLDDTASAAVDDIVFRATHPGRLMSYISAYLLSSTQRRFQTESGPDGTRWKPLSRRTQNRLVARGRRRGALNILRVTTALYRSISERSDELSAEVGTNLVYAAVHQFGGEIQQFARSQRTTLKKVRGGRQRFVKAGTKGGVARNITIGEHTISIPARPYLGFSNEDVREILQIGQDYLEEQSR